MNKIASSSGFLLKLFFFTFLTTPLLAAESVCQQFRIEGAGLVLAEELSRLDSGSLASLGDELESSQILVVNFPESEVCIVDQGENATESQAGSRLEINPQADEFAVAGLIDDSYDVLLRLDLNYQSELLLERIVGEDLGLTDMEFLSDNSGVGAEDFFAEEIGYLTLGSLELNGIFAEVPRYGISYDHYQGIQSGSDNIDNITNGSLGLEVLRDLILTIDFSARTVFFTTP